jgi:hypothetical protein
MPLFGRRRPPVTPRPEPADTPPVAPFGGQPDRRAVPLTRSDLEALVTAYTEADRLAHAGRANLGNGGVGYARRQAAVVMRAAALAGALGHDTVPLPLRDVEMLEYVHATLRNHAPAARGTHDFGLLILRLQALSALCALNGWHYEPDHEAGTIRWVTPVPADGASRMLPGGKGT